MEFRVVVGHPKYQVSQFGGVQIIKTGRLLRASVRRTGESYLRVGLDSPSGGRKTRYIHQLVMQAWVGLPPSRQHEINHKDGNPRNNCLTNLEYISHAQNLLHGYAQNGTVVWNRGLAGQNDHLPKGQRIHRKTTDAQVREIRIDWKAGSMTRVEIGKKFGVSRAQINKIIWGTSRANVT